MFKLNKNSRCLIATPVSHLNEISNFLRDKEDYFVIDEYIDKNNIIDIFKKDNSLDYLFINPNAQGFKIDRDLLSNIDIKGINTCSTGTNHIDLDYCNKKNIKILSLKNDYELINNLPSTSELAFCLLQSLFRKIILCNYQVLDHKLWAYKEVMGNQLSGKKIGCLGYGRLGKIFCKQLRGFDVEVLVCEKNSKYIPKEYKKVSLDELFTSCDGIAIHIHSCKENQNLINEKVLSKAKQGLILINTSRGDICDEVAIKNHIKNGSLGGYATDVLATEFSDFKDSPIYKLAMKKKFNIIITPHVGGMTYEGQNKAFLYAMKKFEII